MKNNSHSNRQVLGVSHRKATAVLNKCESVCSCVSIMLNHLAPGNIWTLLLYCLYQSAVWIFVFQINWNPFARRRPYIINCVSHF